LLPRTQCKLGVRPFRARWLLRGFLSRCAPAAFSKEYKALFLCTQPASAGLDGWGCSLGRSPHHRSSHHLRDTCRVNDSAANTHSNSSRPCSFSVPQTCCCYSEFICNSFFLFGSYQEAKRAERKNICSNFNAFNPNKDGPEGISMLTNFADTPVFSSQIRRL
jgi:hypothetical protein